MEKNDNINENDISLENIRNLINGDIDNLFNDDEIKKAIEESEILVKKNIDDLVNKFKNFKTDINFINKSNNPDPTYIHRGDSGFDLRANLSEPIDLLSGEWKAIPTGLYFEIPEEFELQVRSRSGMSVKHGVVVLNSPGTCDSNYRGEVSVILINHSKVTFRIENGDRIAQGVIAPVLSSNNLNFNKVINLSETTRGENKFGSTGIK